MGKLRNYKSESAAVSRVDFGLVAATWFFFFILCAFCFCFYLCCFNSTLPSTPPLPPLYAPACSFGCVCRFGSFLFSWELEDKLISCLKLLKRLQRGNPCTTFFSLSLPQRSLSLCLLSPPSLSVLKVDIMLAHTHTENPLAFYLV